MSPERKRGKQPLEKLAEGLKLFERAMALEEARLSYAEKMVRNTTSDFGEEDRLVAMGTLCQFAILGGHGGKDAQERVSKLLAERETGSLELLLQLGRTPDEPDGPAAIETLGLFAHRDRRMMRVLGRISQDQNDPSHEAALRAIESANRVE